MSRIVSRTSRGLALLATLVGALALATACAASTSDPLSRGVHIIAAENFGGSIAAQLDGDTGSVHSISVNPPHDQHYYEPTAGDARTLASANLDIVNGVGYDPWASQLLAANSTK